jgi:hypothetical protein
VEANSITIAELALDLSRYLPVRGLAGQATYKATIPFSRA